MFTRKAILVVLAVVLLVGVVTVASSQSFVRSQRWEYAIVMWNVSEGEFSWMVSPVYEMSDFETAFAHDITQQLWDALDETGEAGLSDYLAVMGISGYELVDVTNMQTSALVYTFKRPEKQ